MILKIFWWWFKTDFFLNSNQRRIQNPVKPLRWSFLRKCFILDVRRCSEYVSPDMSCLTMSEEKLPQCINIWWKRQKWGGSQIEKKSDWLWIEWVVPLYYFNCNFIKKETLAQVFSCEFCEISKNIFFTEHLLATASESIWIESLVTSS